MEARIADYGMIGNCRAAALVSRKGSIDWCCLPEFDSPSIFAALLDTAKGGCFSIRPSESFASAQKYVTETNVLETSFSTTYGKVSLTDAFTALTEEEKKGSLFPDHEILRIVAGVSGTVKMKVKFAPKPYYGREYPKLEDDKKLGVRFSWKENIYILGSTLPPGGIKLSKVQDRAYAEFDVRAGERIFFSLTCSGQAPAVLAELKTTAEHRMARTITYWRNWVGQCKYSGLYAEEVRRSALALKLLTHAPSGAIIAAPTTSLPETPGKSRNWDYRYCWLRDASFTTRILVKLGFEAETHAYMNWILHATQLTRPELQVVYAVFGHAYLKEKTLDALSGYRESRPVRVGNGADQQFQLDVYGEVLDAVYAYCPLVKEFDRNSRKFIAGLGEVICKRWREPDNGIWEIRSSCIRHTHSLVMAWVGLDRLIKIFEKYQWKEPGLKTFKETGAAIRDEIEKCGYNKSLGAYTRELNGHSLDASLLVLSLVGYCDPESTRMISTTDRIYAGLSKNNFIYRYRGIDDGLEGEEGSFGICNFWLAENLAKTGRFEKAVEVFETIVRQASPAGLLSEEVDPESGELLGNYPQGFTHIGLINAAISINEAYMKKDIPKA